MDWILAKTSSKGSSYSLSDLTNLLVSLFPVLLYSLFFSLGAYAVIVWGWPQLQKRWPALQPWLNQHTLLLDRLAGLVGVLVCLIDVGRFYLAGYKVNLDYLVLVALFTLVITVVLMMQAPSRPARIKLNSVVQTPDPAAIIIKPKKSLRSAKKLKTKEARSVEITRYIYSQRNKEQTRYTIDNNLLKADYAAEEIETVWHNLLAPPVVEVKKKFTQLPPKGNYTVVVWLFLIIFFYTLFLPSFGKALVGTAGALLLWPFVQRWRWMPVSILVFTFILLAFTF